MASLEKRYDGRYRIVFCWQGERRYHSLGKCPSGMPGPALTGSRRACASSIAGCWKSQPDADLGRFLVSGGKLNGKPVLEAPLTVR